MIKKNWTILGILSFISIIGLFIYSEFKPKTKDLKMYAIKTNYSYIYDYNRSFKTNIYLNDKKNILLSIKDNNVYLTNKSETEIYSLDLIDINVIFDTYYNNERYYCYNIESNLLNQTKDIILDEAYLIISNLKYKQKVFIGTFEMNVVNNKYELFSFESLYGSYTLKDGIKNLIGINIKVKSLIKYEIRDIYISNLVYIDLNEVIFDNFPNFIDESELINSNNGFDISRLEILPGNINLFLPIHSKNKYYINRLHLFFKINNKNYYIDDFIYQSNSLNLDDYESIISKGVLK